MDSFDGCPAPPVPSDIQGGGDNLDLAALRADSAGVLWRPEMSTGDLTAAWPAGVPAEWPADLVGRSLRVKHSTDVE